MSSQDDPAGHGSQLDPKSDGFQERRQNIIEAVETDDMDTLRRLLDSPRWYRIECYKNNNLLGVSVRSRKKELFDYLLSLPNFPLEMVNEHGFTPLLLAVKANYTYYAIELIKKGANVDHINPTNKRSILSISAQQQNVPLTQLCIEKGVDLDDRDSAAETALHLVFRTKKASDINVVSLLLYSGANPRLRSHQGYLAFELLIMRQSSDVSFTRNKTLVDTLFFYTFDKLSITKVDVRILLKLAKFKSPLVHEIDHVFVNYEAIDSNYRDLFAVDVKYLKMFAHKFRDTFKEMLAGRFSQGWPEAVTIEKLDVLLDSGLRDDVISCIQDLKDDCLFSTLIDRGLGESQITDTFCYLVSYGLDISEIGLKRIYNKFGYCDLFEILLHVDIQMESETVRPIIPSIFYDVTRDAESYVENSSRYLSKDLLVLLSYFSNQELLPSVIRMCLNGSFSSLEEKAFHCRITNLSSPPLLVQLARDVFRKYFIRRLKIKNSRQFHTNLKRLRIDEVVKSIITFQKKLYE